MKPAGCIDGMSATTCRWWCCRRQKGNHHRQLQLFPESVLEREGKSLQDLALVGPSISSRNTKRNKEDTKPNASKYAFTNSLVNGPFIYSIANIIRQLM